MRQHDRQIQWCGSLRYHICVCMCVCGDSMSMWPSSSAHRRVRGYLLLTTNGQQARSFAAVERNLPFAEVTCSCSSRSRSRSGYRPRFSLGFISLVHSAFSSSTVSAVLRFCMLVLVTARTFMVSEMLLWYGTGSGGPCFRSWDLSDHAGSPLPRAGVDVGHTHVISGGS